MKRFFLVALILLFTTSAVTIFALEKSQSVMATGNKVPDIEHPIKNPKMYSESLMCPNCGMMINMWARTRHSFHHPEGDFTTCSIHCLADKIVSSGADADNIHVALYIDPDKMIPVDKATYVIGSTAPGTMTMKSKIAFADKTSAEEFVSNYGGQAVDFQAALAEAKMELPESRMMIDKKRKETGKIKEPTEKDVCTVCGMHPASYPKHNSQILTMDGNTLHFCSTQCMINFNADPSKYVQEPTKTKMAWVTLFSDGMYESALGAYYVVGSQLNGPMGKEAFPFKLKKDADEFVKANGGKIISFQQLTPQLIMGAN
jgi:copper chaperone NosL